MAQQIFRGSVGSRIVHVIFSPNLKWYTAYCADISNQRLNTSYTTEDRQKALKYGLDYLSEIIGGEEESQATFDTIKVGQVFLLGVNKYVKYTSGTNPFTRAPCLNLSTGEMEDIEPCVKIIPLQIKEG